VKSLAASPKVTGVMLLGYPGKLAWTQDGHGLRVDLPASAPSEHTATLKISFAQ